MRKLCLLATLSGCGLGWIENQEDRTAGLPTAGAGPYSALESDDTTPATEPRVLNDARADLEDPSALAGGAGLRIWFTRSTAEPVVSEIAYAELPSPRELPTVSPTTVLEASEAWEEAVVSAPHVVEDPQGTLVMFYEGGVAMPSVGRATSSDGLSWTKDPDPVLVGAIAPTAVFVYGETWLFATRPGEVGIWRAVDTGSGFNFDPAPIIVPRPGEPEAFDNIAVSDPFALAVPTLADGVSRVHLWFTGVSDDPDEVAVGYAASFDGIEWPRFGGDKPMLKADATQPSVVLEAAGGLMLSSAAIGGTRFVINAAEH